MTGVKRGAFHSELQFLSGLSRALNKSSVKQLPKVEFGAGGRTEVRWYIWGEDDWNLPEDERREKKRIGIEEEFAKIIDLFPGAAWEKNDPTGGSYGESYYEMKGRWEDVEIRIVTGRTDVCERVVVLEHDVTEEVPDPEYMKAVPLVKVTEKKQVVEWQCNTALAQKTAALDAARLQVTA